MESDKHFIDKCNRIRFHVCLVSIKAPNISGYGQVQSIKCLRFEQKLQDRLISSITAYAGQKYILHLWRQTAPTGDRCCLACGWCCHRFDLNLVKTLKF